VNDPTDKLLERASFPELAQRLSALYSEERDALLLALLGQEYVISRAGITLRGQKAPENHVAVIKDYLSSRGDAFVMIPWRGLGTFPGGATADFRERVEMPLAHHAPEFSSRAKTILPLFDGTLSTSVIGSDVAFTVRALPKVLLHVELSQESQEFPPEAWVLFSNNADDFLSVQGLQLLGELFKDRLLGLLRIY
jgi:hypothetical protein